MLQITNAVSTFVLTKTKCQYQALLVTRMVLCCIMLRWLVMEYSVLPTTLLKNSTV